MFFCSTNMVRLSFCKHSVIKEKSNNFVAVTNNEMSFGTVMA